MRRRLRKNEVYNNVSLIKNIKWLIDPNHDEDPAIYTMGCIYFGNRVPEITIRTHIAGGEEIPDRIENSITVVTGESAEDLMSAFSLDGFEKVDKFSDVYKEACLRTADGYREGYLHAFINDDTRESFVFIDGFDVPKQHYIAVILLPLARWTGLKADKDDIELSNALIKFNSPSKFDEKLYELDFAERRLHINELKMREALGSFEQDSIWQQRDRAKSKIDSGRGRIVSYEEELRSLYDDLAKNIAVYNAMSNASVDNNGELLKYFETNEKLYFVEKSGGQVTYIVHGYCDNYDLDVYEEVKNAEASAMNDAISGLNEDFDDAWALLDAIFVEERFKLKMVSMWTFSAGAYVRPVGHAAFGDRFKDYLPNPHINEYQCMGSWKPTVDSAADRFDYCYAVDVTAVENGNVYFNDPTVMDFFIRDLFMSDHKILTDGENDYTVAEAMEKMKEE